MNAQDRTGQVWTTDPDGLDRKIWSIDRDQIYRESHTCLIVEKPDLGARALARDDSVRYDALMRAT